MEKTEQELINKICLAAEQNCVEEIKRIIEKNPTLDYEKSDKRGSNAFLYAVCKGNKEIVNYLISKGCDMYAFNSSGYFSLTIAACFGKGEIIDLLIDNNIRIDEREKNRKAHTALMEAVANDELRVVKKLMQNGANPNLLNHEGKSVLQMAEEWNREQIVQYFIENCDMFEGEERKKLKKWRLEKVFK